MKILQIMAIVVAVLAIIAGLLAVDYTGMLWQSFIAPKKEDVRRDVWENTRSFREGKRQELIRYMHEYNTAKDSQTKQAIAATVRLNFADVDSSDWEPELQQFKQKCIIGVK